MEKSTFTPEYAILRAALVGARKKAGLTQRELAKRLNVPHSWVAKVECGDRRLDFVELYWLLAACGVEPIPVLRRLLRSFSRSKDRRSKE